MHRWVLTIIGLLYLALGGWCAAFPETTAQSLGYQLSSAGVVEYVVVYGGLEVGLGLGILIGARHPLLFPGVFFMTSLFSLCLPVFRGVMMWLYGSSATLWWLLGGEILIVLLLAACVLFSRRDVVSAATSEARDD
ncbi:hypothetical protein QQM79_08015 [Marinobacteraceae bacterium S3BR75-40.1]